MTLSKIHMVSLALIGIAALIIYGVLSSMRSDFSEASSAIQRESFERLVKEKRER